METRLVSNLRNETPSVVKRIFQINEIDYTDLPVLMENWKRIITNPHYEHLIIFPPDGTDVTQFGIMARSKIEVNIEIHKEDNEKGFWLIRVPFNTRFHSYSPASLNISIEPNDPSIIDPDT